MTPVYRTVLWTAAGTSSTDQHSVLAGAYDPGCDGHMLPATLPPVTPVVVLARFAPAPADWLPAHRGVDLAATPGQTVRSPAACRIAFTGRVAGRPVVSLACHGVRYTFEPVRSRRAAGDPVRAGGPVGTVGHGGHCDARCIHWGAKIGGHYMDPLALLPRRAPVLKPVVR